jgi:hypothetical protein
MPVVAMNGFSGTGQTQIKADVPLEVGVCCSPARRDTPCSGSPVLHRNQTLEMRPESRPNRLGPQPAITSQSDGRLGTAKRTLITDRSVTDTLAVPHFPPSLYSNK